MLLSEKVRKMLCEQITHEARNESRYRVMESYFEAMQLHGFSGLFAKQSEGEFDHRADIIKYLNLKNAKIDYDIIPAPEPISSVKDAVDRFYTVEIETTKKLYAIVKSAQEEGDFGTVAWLYDNLIPEQNEEEALALDVKAQILRISGEDGQVYGVGLELLDSKLAKIYCPVKKSILSVASDD